MTEQEKISQGLQHYHDAVGPEDLQQFLLEVDRFVTRQAARIAELEAKANDQAEYIAESEMALNFETDRIAELEAGLEDAKKIQIDAWDAAWNAALEHAAGVAQTWKECGHDYDVEEEIRALMKS